MEPEAEETGQTTDNLEPHCFNAEKATIHVCMYLEDNKLIRYSFFSNVVECAFFHKLPSV